MKRILFTVTSLIFSFAIAKGGEPITEAEYTVPTSAELIDYSRFIVKINQAYTGDTTKVISYTFPEELTGSPALTVTLSRVPGTKNDWESPEMKASCTTVGDWFSCNIYLNKTQVTETSQQPKMLNLTNLFTGNTIHAKASPLAAAATAINKNNVVDFLTKSAPSADVLKKQIEVLDQFLKSEPAGILSYEFENYGN